MRTLKRLVRRTALLRVCKTITRRKQSTVAERISSNPESMEERKSRLRFAVPARIAHPGWRVSQARLRKDADYDTPDRTEECPAVKSLVSSITQANLSNLLRGVCLHPLPAKLADGAIRILAEPSNNSNSPGFRQQFPVSGDRPIPVMEHAVKHGLRQTHSQPRRLANSLLIMKNICHIQP